MRQKAATYVAVFVLLAIGYVLLRGSSWQGSTELHTLMEVVAALLATAVGILSMARFHALKSNTFLFIGVGFLGTAMLDGYHAVVTSSFFASNFPSAPSSLIPWSWIASRLFLSILLWVSWLAWTRETRMGESGRIGERSVYLAVGAFTIISFLFFALVPLPRAYYPEFMFHRPEEFVPALFFLLALVGYVRKGHWKHDEFEHWLVIALVVGFVSQAVFMSFSGQLFDFEFDSAHMLKKVSYIAVLTGLLINIFSLFKQSEAQKAQLGIEVIDRRRAEEELATRNRDLEMLLYVTSHDLREPLRAIENFSQMVSEGYVDKLDDRGQDFLGRVTRGARRMDQLLEDILMLSRAQRAEATIERVEGRDIVGDAVGGLRAKIEETGAKVQVANEFPVLPVDKTWATQAVFNLVANALKFTRNGEAPDIEIAPYLLNGSHKGAGIAVRDRGIGVPPQQTERIFQLFQRAVGREIEGTGAGLAIVRQIAERYGGRAWVEPREGGGSEFIITFASEHPQGGNNR